MTSSQLRARYISGLNAEVINNTRELALKKHSVLIPLGRRDQSEDTAIVTCRSIGTGSGLHFFFGPCTSCYGTPVGSGGEEKLQQSSVDSVDVSFILRRRPGLKPPAALSLRSLSRPSKLDRHFHAIKE